MHVSQVLCVQPHVALLAAGVIREVLLRREAADVEGVTLHLVHFGSFWKNFVLQLFEGRERPFVQARNVQE